MTLDDRLTAHDKHLARIDKILLALFVFFCAGILSFVALVVGSLINEEVALVLSLGTTIVGAIISFIMMFSTLKE